MNALLCDSHVTPIHQANATISQLSTSLSSEKQEREEVEECYKKRTEELETKVGVLLVAYAWCTSWT